MIYWFTGQPGHGKTLHAIEKLLEYKDQGRMTFACNIREFDYAKTGVLEMTPQQFCDWPNFLPDGAVALVDEAYEHSMLPKRPPGSRVPHHVEQLAKHRHRGLDFIFVSQSPDKQCDQFVHDLIERHVHVRRRFGTQFVHLREFDRFESRPEKANPLIVRRKKLPTRPMGTYKSTELDTTERKIPWYYIALPIFLVAAIVMMYVAFGRMGNRLGGEAITPETNAAQSQAVPRDGASATARGTAQPAKAMTSAEYAKRFLPRIPSEPWSAPAYDDKLSLPSEPPRLFCMSSLTGNNASGDRIGPTCTCLTEQGTQYVLDQQTCRYIARRGQYEPYRARRDDRYVDGPTQIDRGLDSIAERGHGVTSIDRGNRHQGTFPESPGYTTSTSVPSTGIQL
ncbi:zonular occludens toxin domain-containing protein [Xanthomonas oryzae pv. oryzae]|uniref:Phage-related protein n=3 Tax=Xanthomonas oryzae TaxID=347 RepID=Q5H0J9_XANOR|nr:zonular occludens toxin domain-containing protein [Xanthomonas oryzae]AAW75522.1 phage-related protein [Xanthomonas oryzae pv. oryzae KACC 10331]ACD58935.1 phage-related protein [Xanthomonas oryzae pv. oryzae PXO99A]AOS02475.1 zonular occludens toxin family protein [Xanthomonas oryzae pv. oryzae]AXM40021.1 zonular occludens toxin family protein [Xanthomonas oryzae pv. oryzae]AXQ09538.1 zonular occludens toxin family protein [Xanthomonas oryzae pv. oryzae]